MILSFSLWDIIRVPFGYVLEWLYNWTANYGLALILFTVVLKLILFPTSAKSKKSMMKMSRISPQMKLLELKYGDDKENYQKAVQRLYKEEGVSMTGGCLWSLIPLILIIPLYQIIRQPIQYLMHFSPEEAAQIVNVIKDAAPNLFTSGNDYYHQLIAASHIGQYADQIKEALPQLSGSLQSLNFTFLGVDLGQVPNWQIWTYESFDWAHIGLFLTPLVAAGAQMLSMFVSQKMNNQVATNAKGERDDAAAAMANQSTKMMLFVMPIMSLVFCFMMPAAISVYWIAQALFGMVQDFFLTKHYRKVYDAEDAIKREKAAKEALLEAEKERQRELRREQNPDGIMENTSKKKLQQRQKEAAEAAAREYQHKKALEKGIVPPEPEEKPSAVSDRPYARGRAYRADHYQKPEDPAEE